MNGLRDESGKVVKIKPGLIIMRDTLAGTISICTKKGRSVTINGRKSSIHTCMTSKDFAEQLNLLAEFSGNLMLQPVDVAHGVEAFVLHAPQKMRNATPHLT